MTKEPDFEVRVPPENDTGQTLLIGTADLGMAGLTAVDYLTKHLETHQIGHVKSYNLPDLVPFSEGVPRHPIRLYTAEESEITVFVSEIFLPVWVAEPLTETLFDWITTRDIQDVTIPFGAQFPHSEEEHLVFHVGNDQFRENHFGKNTEIDPLPGGYFNGVVGELVTRGLENESPAVGALVTPAHYPGPDLDGALRLIEAIETVYDIDVDEQELKEGSEKMRQQYQELAQRMQAIQEGDQSFQNRDFPEDRMYM